MIMKTLLLFTALFAGCSTSKKCQCWQLIGSGTNPGTTLQDGFIPNIEIDTINVIRLQTHGLIYPVGRIDMMPDSTCKHSVTITTLAYCPDGWCNTVSCFSCGKILGKQ